jgi:hypothetical protein
MLIIDDRFLWEMNSFSVLLDWNVWISRKRKIANFTVSLDMRHFKNNNKE